MGGRGSTGGGGVGGLSKSERNYVTKNLPDKPREYNFYDDAPKLTGTEKQVKWAESIREEIAGKLFDYAMTMTSDGRRSGMIDIAFDGKQAMIKSISENELVKSATGKVRQEKIQRAVSGLKDSVDRYNRVIDLISSHTSASWWIDNRTNSAQNYMNKKLKKIIDGK